MTITKGNGWVGARMFGRIDKVAVFSGKLEYNPTTLPIWRKNLLK